MFRKSVGKCREWMQAGAVTALSMFSQSGEISSTDSQFASTKLLKLRQAAAAYVQHSPVNVKWTGANSMKIHHWSVSDDASFKTKLKHKFHEHGNSVWSLAKTAWSVV